MCAWSFAEGARVCRGPCLRQMSLLLLHKVHYRFKTIVLLCWGPRGRVGARQRRGSSGAAFPGTCTFWTVVQYLAQLLGDRLTPILGIIKPIEEQNMWEQRVPGVVTRLAWQVW